MQKNRQKKYSMKKLNETLCTTKNISMAHFSTQLLLVDLIDEK